MRQVTNSADNLVLLGEMVEMASSYAEQVEESSAQDEPLMVRLAFDQLLYLRKRLSKLDEKLENLHDVLGTRIRMQPRAKQWASEQDALDIELALRQAGDRTH
jgi:hypothetical protein